MHVLNPSSQLTPHVHPRRRSMETCTLRKSMRSAINLRTLFCKWLRWQPKKVANAIWCYYDNFINTTSINMPHQWLVSYQNHIYGVLENATIFSSSLLTLSVTYVCVCCHPNCIQTCIAGTCFGILFLDKDEWLDPPPQHMVQTRPPAGQDRPCLWKGNF
jgi:hypothetical protein